MIHMHNRASQQKCYNYISAIINLLFSEEGQSFKPNHRRFHHHETGFENRDTARTKFLLMFYTFLWNMKSRKEKNYTSYIVRNIFTLYVI